MLLKNAISIYILVSSALIHSSSMDLTPTISQLNTSHNSSQTKAADSNSLTQKTRQTTEPSVKTISPASSNNTAIPITNYLNNSDDTSQSTTDTPSLTHKIGNPETKTSLLSQKTTQIMLANTIALQTPITNAHPETTKTMIMTQTSHLNTSFESTQPELTNTLSTQEFGTLATTKTSLLTQKNAHSDTTKTMTQTSHLNTSFESTQPELTNTTLLTQEFGTLATTKTSLLTQKNAHSETTKTATLPEDTGADEAILLIANVILSSHMSSDPCDASSVFESPDGSCSSEYEAFKSGGKRLCFLKVKLQRIMQKKQG